MTSTPVLSSNDRALFRPSGFHRTRHTMALFVGELVSEAAYNGSFRG